MDYTNITKIILVGGMAILWAIELRRLRRIDPETESVKKENISLRLWIYTILIAVLIPKISIVMSIASY